MTGHFTLRELCTVMSVESWAYFRSNLPNKCTTSTNLVSHDAKRSTNTYLS